MEEQFIPKKRKAAIEKFGASEEVSTPAPDSQQVVCVSDSRVATLFVLREKLSGLYGDTNGQLGTLGMAMFFSTQEEADWYRTRGRKPDAEEVVRVTVSVVA